MSKLSNEEIVKNLKKRLNELPPTAPHEMSWNAWLERELLKILTNSENTLQIVE